MSAPRSTAPAARPWFTRIPLGILAISGINVGLWIQIAPRSFFDDFPGAGHRWVAAFGPYNEHLLRDFGAMNVALGVLAGVALVLNRRSLVRAAAGSWFLFGIQHLGFHLFHVDALEGVDRIASPGALVFVIAAAWVAWWLAPAAEVDGGAAAPAPDPVAGPIR